MTTEASVTGKQSVLAKLQTARIRLQEMKLKKSGHNKFAGYDYFELGDFLPTINRLFHELGLCSIVTFTEDVATLNIHDIDGGGCIVITSPMAEAQLKGCHPIQNLGATQTYLRRYLYVTALEIVEHDALDASEPVKEAKISTGVIKPTDGAGDGLTSVQKEKVDRIRGTVVDCFEANIPEEAYRAIDQANLDTDEKIYLWDNLDSKMRSALKKIGQTKTVTPLHA